MSLKTPLMIATLALAAAMTSNAVARGEQTKAQDTKGHDMSNMQAVRGAGEIPHGLHGNNKGRDAASMELHEIMMSGMKMPMKMTGNVDKDFASMVIMHHQQAVKMADVEIVHGKSAALKAMARKMKAAQQAEIKQLAPYAK